MEKVPKYLSEVFWDTGTGTFYKNENILVRIKMRFRSQASPEVRHVSGQHFHEFREFLLKHPGTFGIDDEKETVVLTNYDQVTNYCYF